MLDWPEERFSFHGTLWIGGHPERGETGGKAEQGAPADAAKHRG